MITTASTTAMVQLHEEKKRYVRTSSVSSSDFICTYIYYIIESSDPGCPEEDTCGSFRYVRSRVSVPCHDLGCPNRGGSMCSANNSVSL